MKTIRLKRNIKYIVVHCSESSEKQTVQGLLDYWKNEKGWHAAGYHYAVEKDGDVIKLLDERKNANGAKGFNHCSVHIGWIGGLAKGERVNNMTRLQEAALFNKVVELSIKYPNAEIVGHKDLPGVIKSCPLFDVKEWLKNYTPDFELNLAA